MKKNTSKVRAFHLKIQVTYQVKSAQIWSSFKEPLVQLLLKADPQDMTAIDWLHIQGVGGGGVLRGALTSLLKDLTRNS